MPPRFGGMNACLVCSALHAHALLVADRSPVLSAPQVRFGEGNLHNAEVMLKVCWVG